MLRRVYHSARRHKWIAACASALLLVTACLWARGWYRAHLVEQELARLRAAGIPTNALELNAFVAIPPGDPNATAAWMKPLTMIDGGAIGRHPYGFDALDKRGHFPPLPGEDWPELERAEEYLAKHQPLFDAIDQAVATPGKCVFVADFSGGGSILLPHTQWSLLMIRLLTMRAHVHAYCGDAISLARDIEAMLQVANNAVDEPIYVTQLSYCHQLEQVTMALERLLPFVDSSSPRLLAIQQELERVDCRRALELSAIGNRVMGLTTLTDPSTTGADYVPPALYQAWVDDNAPSLLRTTRQIDAKIAGDWPMPLELSDRFATTNWDSGSVAAPLGTGVWHAPTKFAELLAGSVQQFACAKPAQMRRRRASRSCVTTMPLAHGRRRSLRSCRSTWKRSRSTLARASR